MGNVGHVRLDPQQAVVVVNLVSDTFYWTELPEYNESSTSIFSSHKSTGITSLCTHFREQACQLALRSVTLHTHHHFLQLQVDVEAEEKQGYDRT